MNWCSKKLTGFRVSSEFVLLVMQLLFFLTVPDTSSGCHGIRTCWSSFLITCCVTDRTVSPSTAGSLYRFVYLSAAERRCRLPLSLV
jgi:hypothetical protein